MSWINILYKVKTLNEPNPDLLLSARLHVNYWKFPSKSDSWFSRLKFWKSNNYTRNLDIGIFLQNVNETLEEVIICLPFKFDVTRVRDLSKHLHNETFLSFLFNHQYRIHSLTDCPTYKYAKTSGDDNENDNFCLYELCDGSKETEELTHGTMLHIKFLSHPKNLNEIREKASPDDKNNRNYNIYVRFRLEELQDNDFCFNEDISNDFLQSAFSKTEMAEIKFNEKRTINHDDYQTITNGRSFLNLSSIHFFFTGSSEDEGVVSTKIFNDCELLDDTLWRNYIDGINPMKKKCISYHWKLDTAQSNKIFFKTVYSSRDKSKMFKYALVVIILSFIASVLWDCVKCTGKYLVNLYSTQDSISVSNSTCQHDLKDNIVVTSKNNNHMKVMK